TAGLKERRRLEHLLHSGAALRPFVADQHDVARAHAVAEDAFARRILALEDDGASAEAQQLRVDTGSLDDAALLGEVAVQHRKPAVCTVRVLDVAHATARHVEIERFPAPILREGARRALAARRRAEELDDLGSRRTAHVPTLDRFAE